MSDPLTMHLAFRSLCRHAETNSVIRAAIFDPSNSHLLLPPSNSNTPSQWKIVLHIATIFAAGYLHVTCFFVLFDRFLRLRATLWMDWPTYQLPSKQYRDQHLKVFS